jgi:hypothetical protein
MCEETDQQDIPEPDDIVESNLLLAEAVNRLRYCVCKLLKVIEENARKLEE